MTYATDDACIYSVYKSSPSFSLVGNILLVISYLYNVHVSLCTGTYLLAPAWRDSLSSRKDGFKFGHFDFKILSTEATIYKSRHHQTTSFETTFEISTYNLHKINELLQIDMNRA